MRLKDKTAIVTGGGGGIGRGIVRAFAREGARVCVMDITEEVAWRGAKEAGEGALALGVDVTKEAEVARAVKTAIERLGRVDILVNCHGRPSRLMANPVDRLTLEEWNEVFAVNTVGVFLMCRAIAPHMRERRYGKVINIASLAARRANENVPHYCAAKAACLSFTLSFAKEMAKHSVNVNAINPGLLWTDLWEKGHGVIIGLDTDKSPREVFDAFVKSAVPLGREQTPDDVGHMAVYLASDESRNVTGQGLMLAGGAWMV
ncbi:MAG: glucose 1-dehydrogenase [Candidatus Tectomicrobia bacterium]|nr:glucose 1-dehydrogenase [Candidatus Tectomicrobia bacterium]